MVKSTRSVLLFLFMCQFAMAQSTDSLQSSIESSFTPTENTNDSIPKFDGIIIKPTIGLGVGTFTYIGDIRSTTFQKPTISRIAYELGISQKLSNSFSLNFNVLFGKLGANERQSPNNRNLNFESEIRSGGVSIGYNFDNFLPIDRSASPFISIGFESFEFLSKTDAYDQYGNAYFYWSDGSIRNIDENSTNASSAVEINRDYSYETDIREMDLDSFGKYQERSFAIPIGIGATFEINDYINFKIGTVLHLTLTDYLDGVTSKSIGNRVGDSKNDRFLMTSCSISYNFGTKETDKDAEDNLRYKDVDFLALDQYDYDKDGVIDLKDLCQGTPIGVVVDTAGCPLDDDRDNYPNYRDDEILSPSNAVVDIRGVELTLDKIEEMYKRYIDSTMAFANVDYKTHPGVKPTLDPNQKVYSVSLGTYETGVPADLMTKFLSLKNISTNSNGKSTTYTSGKFDDIEKARLLIEELKQKGLDNLKIVYQQNGKFYDASTNELDSSIPVVTATSESPKTETITNTQSANNKIEEGKAPTLTNTQPAETIVGKATNTGATAKTTSPSNNNSLNVPGVVLRVQLGAYSKPVSKGVFRGVDDLIEVQTEKGLYKYFSGAFDTFEKAAKHKLEMVVEGYEGAFIVAFKDGERISLKQAGATPAEQGNELEVPAEDPANKVRKDLVKFKVQVGVFKNQPPAEVLSIFSQLQNIVGEQTKSGLTRYVAGEFNSYEEAKTYQSELISKYGLTDAFIVALFNNEYISVQEAQLLLK